MSRIYLSPPHLSGRELELVKDAIEGNWIAPVGPHLDAFESEVAEVVGVAHAAALSSGTAALHLAMILCEVGPGDEGMCADLTFSASANAIAYVGAKPVFIDATPDSWNLDPDLVEEELVDLARKGRRPRAVVAVDLYGQCADYERLEEICERFGVPLIEDAAEALGASYRGRAAGSFGRIGVISFNGNKIITTSGGGMLVSNDDAIVGRARFLATQARDPAPHYEHSTIGYNYRLSNLLAAVGRAQSRVWEERVALRRRNFDHYRAELGGLPGVDFMPEAPYGQCNRWLTCMTIDPRKSGATREDVRAALERENIEARPVWKPMHLQPVFVGCRTRGGRVSRRLFETGLCLPSGSNLGDGDRERVIAVVKGCLAEGR